MTNPRLSFRRPPGLVLVVFLLLVALEAAHAQYGYTFTKLHAFFGPDGLGPEATLIQGSDGNFYGTTSGAYASTSDSPDPATNGTVFRVTPAGLVTNLHVFAGTDGAHPKSPLVQLPNGLLYGSTSGGFSGSGPTIFSVATDGTGFKTLVQGAAQEGETNITLVKGADGNLYGTDRQGGSVGYGAIFQLTPAGVVTILYSFQGLPDGEFPNGPLYQAANGNFYGSTGGGGVNQDGTIFRISPAGAYASLYTLTDTDGSGPTGLVQASDGNFYGACQQGGDPNYPPSGTVFRVTPGGAFTKLLDLGYGFGEFPPRDSSPLSNLIVGPDGALYGTGLQGGETGTANGGVFRMSLSGEYSPVYAFDGNDGSGPYGGLVLGKDGSFYGTTSGYVAQTDAVSGGDQDGTVFKLAPPAAIVVPKVTLTAAKPSVKAGSGEKDVLTVSLSSAGTTPLVIKYQLEGSAENGKDYVMLTGKLKIQAGKRNKTITVVPKGDLDGAKRKTLSIRLEAGTGYKVETTAAIKIEILRK